MKSTLRILASITALLFLSGATLCVAASDDSAQPLSPRTATPIRHLIVVVGENQTFDGLFATYVPNPGSTIRNLLSQGIVNEKGEPGPRFSLAQQSIAKPQPHYALSLERAGAYRSLPQPRLIGVQDQTFHDVGRGIDARFPANLPMGHFRSHGMFRI